MSDFDLMSLIGNDTLEMNCPNCNAKVPFTLNSAGKSIECPQCKVKINLNKSNDFDENIDTTKDSLKELEETINNFGK